MMKRLCIDIDGCLCEYQFPQIVKSFFGVSIEKYAIFAYDLADVLGVSHLMIDTMFKEQVWGKPTFMPDALETLQAWYGKYEIGIFSNRVKYMSVEGLMNWLNKHNIPWDWIDAHGEEEVYDFHIDDSPAKLMSTNSKVKLLYNQSWNKRCLDITDSLRRVHSWKEIKDIVEDTDGK